MKYKVGDRVEVINDKHIYHYLPIGSKATVLELNTKGYNNTVYLKGVNESGKSINQTLHIKSIKMATKNPKMVEAGKKAATTRKKASIETKVIKPLRKYGSYRIYTIGTKGRRSFGCGAVEVNAKDLLVLADALENNKKELVEFEKIYADLERKGYGVNEVFSKPEVLTFISKIVKNKNLKAFVTVYSQAKRYRSMKHLLRISPNTYRRIAQ